MEEWQRRWSKRAQAVRQAVEAADRIIMEASDGSKEETDYLTAQVAEGVDEEGAHDPALGHPEV